MFRSRMLPFLLCISTFLLFTSCGNGHDSKEKYYLVASNVGIPYWQGAVAGFRAAGEKLKVKTIVAGPNTFDPKEQKLALDDAIQSGATGILVSVSDPKLLQESIDRAMAAGIPVITIDSDAPASHRLYFVGTNNYQAGVSGGKRLAEELKGKGNVVVFTMPDQPNLAERLRGYRDALQSSPGIKITQVVDIQGDPRVAFDTMNTLVGMKNQTIDAAVCLEAQAGKEVAAVLNNDHVKGVTVIAFDTDADTLDWIQKGVIAATIAQKPYTMAYAGLLGLDSLFHNKLDPLDADWSKRGFSPVPTFVDTGSGIIDKSNLDGFLQAQKNATPGAK